MFFELLTRSAILVCSLKLARMNDLQRAFVDFFWLELVCMCICAELVLFVE
jgi:hypothetical protein